MSAAVEQRALQVLKKYLSSITARVILESCKGAGVDPAHYVAAVRAGARLFLHPRDWVALALDLDELERDSASLCA